MNEVPGSMVALKYPKTLQKEGMEQKKKRNKLMKKQWLGRFFWMKIWDKIEKVNRSYGIKLKMMRCI